MEPLGIQGAAVFTPRIHEDERGSFLEAYRADRLEGKLGRRFNLAQVNCSTSAKGVLRGIHFADVPPGQAKYVMCISGAIMDVVVDLRVGSPTFGRWERVRLDDQRRRGLYVAEGLGHGFLALTEGTTVVYFCSEFYNPDGEHEVHPLDPELRIDWRGAENMDGVEPRLSAKDAAAPTLAEAREAGLLPDYDRCLAYEAELKLDLDGLAARGGRGCAG